MGDLKISDIYKLMSRFSITDFVLVCWEDDIFIGKGFEELFSALGDKAMNPKYRSGHLIQFEYGNWFISAKSEYK